MSPRRCAQLAAWGSAWLCGAVAFDDVLDAVDAHGADAAVRHTAGPGYPAGTLHPVSEALTSWKRSGAGALRLALPIPGDVRGLDGPASFREVALEAGEAVFGTGFGVTVSARPTPSSAALELLWRRADILDPRPDPLSVGDAEHDLTEAIRESASELGRRGSASWLADTAPALSDARRAGERLHLPASHPPRAVRLIAQAERLSAVLTLVDRDDTGELTAGGATERAQLLVPLRVAVRRALLAGYNAAADLDSSLA